MEYTIENMEVKRNQTNNGTRYVITGIVNGMPCHYYTNDSLIFDWWNDDSEMDFHLHAVRECRTKLIDSFLYLSA